MAETDETRSEAQALLERMKADDVKLAAVADRLDELKTSIGIASDKTRQPPEETETPARSFFLALRKLIEHRERQTARITASVEDIVRGF